MAKTIIAWILIWPIMGCILHILMPRNHNHLRKTVQTFLTMSWLILMVTLLINTQAPISIRMGHWPAPFGITLVNDELSNLMLVIFALVAICINFYSYHDQEIIEKQQPFYCGFWLLLLGISNAILTSDLFNLYVWFEVILVSAFILLACAKKPKPRAIMEYAIINIIGTLLMLLSVAFIYGTFGSLNYASIALTLQITQTNSTVIILCLFLFAVGLKGGVFPLYFWLPKAYPKPSTSSTMLLSSLITKTVMVILLRLAWLWPPIHSTYLSNALSWVAMATMFFGVMGAANQFQFKGILSFHIISQLGYILFAIAMPIRNAIIATVCFIIHNIFVKTNLFMISGTLQQNIGSDDIKLHPQIIKKHKWLATSFFLSAMSLAGFPPLSGFWAKLLVIQSALTIQYNTGVFVAIVVSLFTLYSMIKIWRYIFCEPATLETSYNTIPIKFSWTLFLSFFLLCFIPILIGVWPDILLQPLKIISNQLSDSQNYIKLVLGREV